MTSDHSPPTPNKTDAGNGSKGICRVSNVLCSPSPDPGRQRKDNFTIMNNTSDQDAIKELIKSWDDALYNKDIGRLVSHNTKDCITFDVGSQVKGPDAIKALWDPCLQFFGDHIGIQRRDEALVVTDSMALFTSYNRLTGMDSDMDAAKSWLRATIVLQKIDGEWKICHEHISFPFDCEKEKPAYILD